MSTVICDKCLQNGHYAHCCPNPEASTGDKVKEKEKPKEKEKDRGNSHQHLMEGVMEGELDDDEYVEYHFAQTDFDDVVLHTSTHRAIPDTGILLDSQSTVDVFHNRKLLKNIWQSKKGMNIPCNAGVQSTNMIRELPGYGTVWYIAQGITNILSLSRVNACGNNVTYNSERNSFSMATPTGKTHIFEQSPRGLYYLDTSASDFVMVTTVDQQRTKYTKRAYAQATAARSLQRTIGRPSTRTSIEMVDSNLIPNCPVTRDDIIAAEHIFGPDLGILEGKTVWQKTAAVRLNTVNIPSGLMMQYRDITLSGDVMFVNQVPFFVTIAQHVKFGTVEMLQSQHARVIMIAIKQVSKIYRRRGFWVTNMSMDGQFESIRGDLAELQINLNITSANEHVPEVERYIRTLKERTRAVYNTMPFQKVPLRMVAEMVYSSRFWLNSFPALDGISKVLSPRDIITESSIDYNRHCQLEFGSYVQTHEDHDNTMATSTIGAIVLRPTGNAQGGYYFLNLTTGRRINRYKWTTLPMPREVID
jgi:hypothetical protein